MIIANPTVAYNEVSFDFCFFRGGANRNSSLRGIKGMSSEIRGCGGGNGCGGGGGTGSGGGV